ncbi:MAG: SMC-Scp complex subunit ScpB [Candidatus Bathyarchaeota archaeon]|nr:SMC-Scp complex subunit ScpB [Candidatus Bathyarchaeota archaeon]MDH5532019.1 SMC-Scp complex subunit ScpB [Candidatus Bathyarchaeota archaeon]MDH5712446.1 SMC-Scp complex subunit ScpB [Candidatus Bathyarchaeota archaeon]
MEVREQELSERFGLEKVRRKLALIEAALYVAGRPLDLKTLGSVINSRSKRKIKMLTGALMKEFENRNTALEIIELEDERFVMQLKAEYTPRVRRLAIRPLLTVGPLKTLSYIAYRQPVSQTRVIDVRGHHAYNHLKQLEELGLIHRERIGRTKVIETTEFFADYFSLSHDMRTMKKQLKSIFGEFAKPES